MGQKHATFPQNKQKERKELYLYQESITQRKLGFFLLFSVNFPLLLTHVRQFFRTPKRSSRHAWYFKKLKKGRERAKKKLQRTVLYPISSPEEIDQDDMNTEY